MTNKSIIAEGVQVIAHRGASGHAQENSLNAFKLAAEMGADWVEMDVRKSSDGMLIVHHDANLADRRIIADTPRSELPSEIPSFAEALEACEGTGVVVEIKNFPNEPGYDTEHMISIAVAGTLRAYRDTKDILVISFNLDSVNHIRALDPEIATGFLVFDPVLASQSVQMARDNDHSVISFHSSNISEALVGRAHDAGLLVHVWTVNEAEQMRHFVEVGVDGIVSDYPDIARKTIDKAGKKSKRKRRAS